MTETEFPWGEVTAESDSETDQTNIDVTIEDGGDVSVVTASTDDSTTDSIDHEEIAELEWGTVAYTTDDDTGATDVTVIVDAEDDVSVSVTTVSEDGTQESTSTVHQSSTTAGTDGDAGADVNVSQSTTVSQSSVNVDSSTVVHGEDGEDGEDGSSVSIDID
ncbi:hypothetical protein RBH26_12845 [Natronolimnohabitans sp. A-GB9]|uniref:hypothetical protein n=1 Tax=Natronolimnohabitans sp. A-GB9 TaxID=3069757 RepID=UPI0027B40A1D|nr:hypothetical protein [Natronolimnohabitans sp. A-GB9]MDQ2051364.1 hypothetical protein [Natronolimnohabitans sp. A-GB9]